MNHIKHNRRWNDAAKAERLEDAKVRFRDAIMQNKGVEIFIEGRMGNQGFYRTVYHCDAVTERDSPAMWATIRIAHSEAHREFGSQVAIKALAEKLDEAIDDATERYAPLMLAAEDERVAEGEPDDAEFFGRMAG